MTRPSLLLAAIAAVLAGCATVALPPSGDGVSRAHIGQTVATDGPRVTPLSLVEDSRCPMNARCVWAGRVRMTARIGLGSGSQTRELTLGEPIAVADGNLELMEVTPARMTNDGVKPKDYTFGFRFTGGL